MYNFSFLLLNVQCMDTDVHAGGLLGSEFNVCEGEKASEQRTHKSDVFIRFKN
jgi:hypothetical protein